METQSNISDRKIDDESKVIREDVLQCLSRKNKYYRVVLTSSELLLQPQSLKHQEQQSLEQYSIEELFGCHTLRHKNNGPTYSSAYICFYLYPRRKRVLLSKTKLREKVPIVFEVRKGTSSYEENMAIATKWKEDALKVLQRKYPRWQSRNQSSISEGEVELTLRGKEEGKILSLSKTFLFTRKYLVVVNPISGQGKGVANFHDNIHPILLEAGIKVELFITEHSGHAKSVLTTSDLSHLDGILTVGGDGLLYEVVNGLRSRSDVDNVSKIPVGVIASGSGNGLARSIANYVKEDPDYLKNPVMTTTLACARGKVIPVNLLDVDLDGKQISAFLSVGWGLLADIDIESEVLRALGEPRFTVWGLLRLAKLRFYKAHLSYTPFQARDDLPAIPQRDPVSFESDFISVYSSCQSYIGSDMAFAPDAKPGDGLIHLTYLTKDAGRGSAIQFLLGIEKGAHLNVSGVSYVTVKEFSIRYPGGISGNLTIDGEAVTGEEISVKVSPKPLYVFTL